MTWFGENKKDTQLRKRIDYDIKKDIQQKLNANQDQWISKLLADSYLEYAPDIRFLALGIASMLSPLNFLCCGGIRKNKHITALNPTDLDLANLKKALHHIWVAGRYLGAIYDSRDQAYHEKLNEQTLKQDQTGEK